MSEDLRIVAGRHEDLIALKPLWLEFVTYHHQLDPRFKLSARAWPVILENFVRSLGDDESVLLVAYAGKQLVGYVYGFIFHNNPGYYPKRVGFIRDLSVLRDFQRRGIATRLVQGVEDWFKDRQIDVVQLYAAHKNESGLATWSQLGYDNYVVGLWKEMGHTTPGPEQP